MPPEIITKPPVIDTPPPTDSLKVGNVVEIEGAKIEVLIPENTLLRRVDELADDVYRDFSGNDNSLLLVGVLKGATTVLNDVGLALGRGGPKRDRMLVEYDFVGKSSYGKGTVSSGEVKTTLGLKTNVEGRNVLIVEDIAETARTLENLKYETLAKNPKSLRILVLLNKITERREFDILLDYVGFDIADEFVVGRGLDDAEHYRNLPFVGIVL